MKKSVLTLFLFLFSLSEISSQWTLKTNGLPETWSHGWAIDACDVNTVVISIHCTNLQYNVYLTENAGAIWTDINAPNESTEDISIMDKDHIWIATATGRIYSTTDGGTNWTLQFHDETLTDFMNYIEMFDLNNGIAMGDAVAQNPVLFLKTTNGGNTWINTNETQLLGASSGDVWRRLDFVSPEIGYFYSTGGNQFFYKTTNGGASWQETSYNLSLDLVKFFNELFGITYKDNYYNNDYDNPIPTLYRTTDGGVNFNSFQISTAGYPNDFEFLPGNPNFVWFVTSSNLYYSQDMGETWTEHYIMDSDIMGRDIVFVDDNHGWLLCDNGRVYYTENNGSIITDVDENSPSIIPTSFQLMQNYPNPFNPVTKINYCIPDVGTRHDMPTILKVYDILGNEVATLVDEQKSPGIYQVEFNGTNLSSGIYFYTLQAGNFTETKKLVLMK